MSVETRDQQEFERYMAWQREQRPHRIETLGGAATTLVLATFDMGLSEVHDPSSESRRERAEHHDATAEVIPLRAARERRLAGFATESAELGYAKAA